MKYWEKFDEQRMVLVSYEGVEVPAEYDVCGRCGGKGRHTNPNIDGNGITADEWAEWSYEDREMYLNGGFDVQCEECKGKRVVPVPCEDLTEEQQEAVNEVNESWHNDMMEDRMRRLSPGGQW